MLTTILLVFAFVLLVIESFSLVASPKVKLGWLGLALWVLSMLLVGVRF